LFLILFHSDICVGFLGTHMISLVLFFRKPGVTRTDTAEAFTRRVLNIVYTGKHVRLTTVQLNPEQQQDLRRAKV
jgi:hypothetical protein